MAEIAIREGLNDGGYGVPDTYANSFAPTTNYGSNVSWIVGAGNEKSSPKFHGFVLFDTGVIPAGATINSAELRLYIENAAASAEAGKIYRTRTNWVESELTWSQYKSGYNWTIPGGDYYGVSVDFTFPTSTGDFIITGLKDLVDDAIKNQNNKLSLYLKRATESSPDAYISVTSGEELIETQWRPRLVVDYTEAAGNPWWYWQMLRRRRAC